MRRSDSQAGFTIIEALVASLVVMLVAAGSATAFVSAIGESNIQRSRTGAEALAQQNEARLRGYTVDQLANLNQDVAPSSSLADCSSTASVKLDGNCYTIHESATFVSDSAGAPSCTNPSADYLETTSTVSWDNMPSSLPPITVTGLVTPSVGEISSTTGVLAVQVQDNNSDPIAGMPVSVSGPSSASGVTASNGCVLFGDLTTGAYTVDVTPSSGTYVDGQSGQTVDAAHPDVQNVTVSAGTTAASPTPFILTTPGQATFSFTDLFPKAEGVSPTSPVTATAPSVILSNSNLNSPSYIACSAQDTSGCPQVGKADASWGTAAWSANGGALTAQPLAPYVYATYAGTCTSDDPRYFGGSDVSSAVTSGQDTNVALSLPAMVIRLWTGAGTSGVQVGALSPQGAGSEEAMPSGSKLVITDLGCSTTYVGGPSVSAPSGDSALPVSASPQTNAGSNDVGLLSYPGMAYGKYSVCYQAGAGHTEVSTVVNDGSGEIVDLFAGASTLTAGACAT